MQNISRTVALALIATAALMVSGCAVGPGGPDFGVGAGFAGYGLYDGAYEGGYGPYYGDRIGVGGYGHRGFYGQHHLYGGGYHGHSFGHFGGGHGFHGGGGFGGGHGGGGHGGGGGHR